MKENRYRTALISGGASGIGNAIAQKFTADGVKTAVADLHLQNQSDNIHYFPCDVSSGSDMQKLFAEVSSSIGIPDILVCNAGRGIHEKLCEGDPEKWEKVVQTNILGTLRMIRAFVPEMMKNGMGDVVFISSVAAGKAFPYGGVYAATKSAIDTIAETLRIETQPQIRVTTVAPGVTDTDFFKNTISGFQTADDIGWGSISPDEVADSVLFAVNKPKDVSVNYLTIRPAAQPL